MGANGSFSPAEAIAGQVTRRRLLQSAAVAGTAAAGTGLLGGVLWEPSLGAPVGDGQRGADVRPVMRGASEKFRDLEWGLYANNPFGILSERRFILDTMIRALRGAPRGATAHFTAFAGVEPMLTAEIIAAHRRGVHCRVSMDDLMRGSRRQEEIAAALGTNRHRGSCFVSLDGTGRAGDGNAHGKLFAISRTGHSGRPFTMVGSSNMGTMDVVQKWNTMYGVRRPRVYAWFARVHEEILADTPLRVPYRRGGPYGRFERCMAYVYPDPNPAWEADDRYRFFKSIDPRGAKIYTTQHVWGSKGRGRQLAQLMIDLVAARAKVFVNGGEHVEPETIDMLRSGGVNAVPCGRDNGNGLTVWPHCKYWVVVSPNDEYCKVMEGSANAMMEDTSEDFALVVNGRDAAEAYAQHWAIVRRVSTAPS